MKRNCVLLCLCVLISAATFAQSNLQQLPLLPTIPTYNLELPWHKTRLLVFPTEIKSADRGDKYVLAETFADVKNILKVKAGEQDFEASNLQVVTADGKVYSFTVNYSEDAPAFPVDMGRQKPYAAATFEGVSLNSKQLEELSGEVAGKYAFLHGCRFHKYGMRLSLEGIYIKEDVLFFQLRLHNKTQIPYQAASIRFYVRDKKKAKRTASQDREVEPLMVQSTGIPESEKGQTIITCFPRFTIAEKKFFAIEFMEQDGDRNPAIKLDQDKLLKARGL